MPGGVGASGRVQRLVQGGAGRGWLVGQAGGAAQLAVVEVVVADRPDRRRVHMDGDGSGLVIHPVDALAGEPETLTRAVLTRPRRPANGERLVPGPALQHVHADTRTRVVVVTGVARLPPQIEPRFGMIIPPQQHRLTRTVAVEPAGLDQRRRQAGPFRAFLRRQRPIAGGDRPQPRCVHLPQRRVHGRRSYRRRGHAPRSLPWHAFTQAGGAYGSVLRCRERRLGSCREHPPAISPKGL